MTASAATLGSIRTRLPLGAGAARNCARCGWTPIVRRKDHPHLSWEALPEGVACVEIAKQVQEEVDSEAFLASLPKRLREVLELRLAGYSWAEAAQRLGVKASTLRGYLPALRAKFVAFFGYDPSKRGFESLIYMEGENSPSDEPGGDGDEDDGTEEQGFSDDTESAGGG
jgi:hypothetical protein